MRLWLGLAYACVSLLVGGAMGQTGATGESSTTLHRLNPAPPAFTSTGFGYGPAGTLISAKANAPFSAAVTEQVDEMLNDGTTIHRESQETIMRDSAGRIYRARSLSRLPHADAEPFQMVTIIDTVQHVQYVCSTLRKSARRWNTIARQTFAAQA